MTDNRRVREVNALVGICFIGAFALFAVLFILSLSTARPSPTSTPAAATATTTAQ